jgi:hypothetical protein
MVWTEVKLRKEKSYDATSQVGSARCCQSKFFPHFSITDTVLATSGGVKSPRIGTHPKIIQLDLLKSKDGIGIWGNGRLELGPKQC